jgi:nucleoside-diphosphate-sugar epimerase
MVERYLQGLIRFLVDGGLSFFDVRDAAAGLVLLEERGRTGERTILTNREGNLSIRDFYARVGEVTGVRRRQLQVPVAVAVAAARLAPWVVHADEVKAVANWWFYDPAKAERELGLAPRPIEETIAATASDYL